MKNLKCIHCRQKFDKITLENGAAVCPHCKGEVFRYAAPDQELTREYLMDFLFTDAGKQAGHSAARFFTSKNIVLRTVAGGMLVQEVINTLKSTLPAPTEPASEETALDE